MDEVIGDVAERMKEAVRGLTRNGRAVDDESAQESRPCGALPGGSCQRRVLSWAA